MLRWIAVTIVSIATVGSTTVRHVGDLRVVVHQGQWEPWWEPGNPTNVRVEDRHKVTLWRSSLGLSRSIHVTRLHHLVAVEGVGLRADGVQVEVHLLARVANQLRETVTPMSVDILDGVCLSRDSSRLTTAIQSDEKCVMCWPKRFDLQHYVWRDGQFVAKSKLRTRREYKSGADAARREGGGCDLDVLELIER